MALTAQSIILRAVGVLQDTTSIRWPASELVRWLNDAQREVVMVRPDVLNTTATMTLAAGSRQDLDNAALTPAPSKLIEITRNVAATSAKGAVRLVPRQILDAQIPGWHAMTPKVDVLHYMFDPRDPKTFYVYPPATALAQLEVMYSAFPTDIAEPTVGALYTDVVGAISLPDNFGNVILDLILARAYSKDSEYAGNLQRAEFYRASAGAALGGELKGTLAVQPQYKPGTPSAVA
jgi:hypothetical protein